MKVLFLALVFSICSLRFALADVEVRGVFKDPAHPGKCVYEGMVLSFLERAKLPGTCGRIICFEESIASIQTCPIIRPPTGCAYTDYVDINAPYDECCSQKLYCDHLL